MLKCSPGFWQKRELYKIEKSLIVFEKKKRLCCNNIKKHQKVLKNGKNVL